MGPEVFLEHYRIVSAETETPVEIGRNGPAVTYKASDLRSGAPVALTLIPIASVDSAETERFEEKARTALLLDHVNIARIVAFGRANDSFVFVSEYPQGETVEAWVNANGPMPADAVLRVALQVVAALGAASFHGLNHPAVQPFNLVIVSGKTAEGGWPFVKLTHFALAGLKSAPGLSEPDLGTSDFASPEQLLQGKVDFRSEIYSLGATMCFLLTGVFYSAYPRSPQTKRFARPLRTLIARTLEDDPAERPQDPVLFTEELRTCLSAIERRQKLKRQFGIPFPPVVAKPPRLRRFRRKRPTPLVATLGPTVQKPSEPVVRPSRFRPAWAIGAGTALLAIGIIAALLLPEDVVTSALHRKKPIETIGVPVGVPDASLSAVVQNKTIPPEPTQQSLNAEVAAAVTSQSPATNSMPAATSASTISHPALIAQQQSPPPPGESATSTVRQSPEVEDTRGEPPPTTSASSSVPAAVAAAPNKSEVTAPESSPPVRVAANNVTPEPARPAEAPNENTENQSDQPVVSDQSHADIEAAPAGPGPERRATDAKPAVSGSQSSKSRGKKTGSVAQSNERSMKPRVPRALPVEPDSRPAHSGTVRARVVGITPAGNVILALPSGERAIVAPQDAEHYGEPQRTYRRPHRVIIERRIFVPQYPSPYQPFIPPDA